MRVTVIGGGIVGLCCALELHRGGAEVTLLERDDCGRATSRGNAGWIMPATTLPVAAPGVVGQAVRGLFNPRSPAHLRPRLDPEFARWCWHFWRHASGSRYQQVLDAMLAFSRHTVQSFDALEALGIEFEMRDDGVLIAAFDQSALGHYRDLMADQARRGYPEFGDMDDLDARDARDLEPALSDRVAGAIVIRHSRQVRPETVCAGIHRYLMNAGVTIMEQTAVTGLQADEKRGWRINTAHDTLHADAVVVAAGLWSKPLMKSLGVNLPLLGARGCSITARGSGTRPLRSIKMAEAQVALNPFRDAVRLSGTWDLGVSAGLDPTRLRHVIDTASGYLADWRPVGDVEFEWAGLRPSTPDSLPLIGPVPGREGLYLATGHGMFGLTYGPVTGTAIRSMLLEGKTPPEVQPFNVGRWVN